jgi:hypothetical protein
MHNDIGPILNKWKYVPTDINVRLIEGKDGKKKIQMRLDLGILQMELDGRPDGEKPHKCDSFLSYFQRKSKAAKLEFSLTALDCMKLQQEAIQYYHRYLALMRLGDYTRVARDTKRNIQVFDFVYSHAPDEELKWSFEQYRPYVIMMNTRALASISLQNNNHKEALKIIQKGLDKMDRFYEKHGENLVDQRIEMEFLKEWAKEIEEQKPLSQTEKLKIELKNAVEKEDYEKAAALRDKLKFIESRINDINKQF